MNADALVQRIVARAQATLDEIVTVSVQHTWEQVPAYAANPDPDLYADLTAHVEAVFRTVLETMAEQRSAERDDFPITTEQARRRVRQGITLADFLRAYRVNQVSLWQSLIKAATAEGADHESVLHLATHVMEVIEVGSTVAAEAYLQAQQVDLAESERLRRDLMEDLLAGRDPDTYLKRELAATLGLRNLSRLVVASGVATRPLRDDRSMRDALTTMRAIVGTGQPGLAVIRQDELVGVVPLASASPAGLVAALERAHERLASQGIELAIGLSTVHAGPAAVPQAYGEALVAREGLAGRAGVLSLPMLNSFDYLVLRDDETARRLIRPELRRFIADDRARGGVLVGTLLEYVRNDLNATVTAAAMHMHVNTAYYRLERIAERTGCDLRKFSDLQELLIAVRLLARPEPAESADL